MIVAVICAAVAALAGGLSGWLVHREISISRGGREFGKEWLRRRCKSVGKKIGEVINEDGAAIARHPKSRARAKAFATAYRKVLEQGFYCTKDGER